MRGGERVDGILKQMARVLNSNEQFQLDNSFQLLFTQVHTASLGSGMKRKMKLSLPSQNFQTFQTYCGDDQKQRQVMLCSCHCHCQSQGRQSPKIREF